MADNMKPLQTQPFYLAGSGSAIGDTTIILESMLMIDGATEIEMTDIGIKGYGTLEPGSGTQEESITWEDITQNANGTATLTGVKSALFEYPFSETAGLAKSHPGGVTFIISNTSAFYNDILFKNNDETVTGTYTFPNSDTSRIRLAADTDTAVPECLVTLGQLSRQAIAGAADASETVKGLVELATYAESAAGTSVGATGARLVPPNSLFTETPTASKIPVASTGGKLANDWLNTGTTTGTIPVLIATDALPAVDGSNLTKQRFIGVQNGNWNATYYTIIEHWIDTINNGASTDYTNWTQSGTGTNFKFNSYTLAPSSDTQFTVIKNEGHYYNGTTTLSGNNTFICEFVLTCSSNTISRQFGFGLASGVDAFADYDIATVKALCFTCNGSGAGRTVYAKTSNGGGGSDHTETSITISDLSIPHTYRIEFTTGVNAKFYVDGTLLATVTTTLPTGSTALLFGMGTAGNSGYPSAVGPVSFAVNK